MEEITIKIILNLKKIYGFFEKEFSLYHFQTLCYFENNYFFGEIDLSENGTFNSKFEKSKDEKDQKFDVLYYKFKKGKFGFLEGNCYMFLKETSQWPYEAGFYWAMPREFAIVRFVDPSLKEEAALCFGDVFDCDDSLRTGTNTIFSV